MATTTVYYSDLDSNLTRNPINNDITRDINADAIENSIVGIVSTKKGSVPFYPDFGCDIDSQLFENFGAVTSNTIKIQIKEALETYEPRINIINVSVVADADNNKYEVTIEYSINQEYAVVYKTLLELEE